MKRTFKDHKYCQACIFEEENGTFLVSYTTTVCDVDQDGWLHCSGTYSATTRKHIGYFCEEMNYKICYQDVKRAYEKDMFVNVWTGEFKPLPEIKPIMHAAG